MQQGDSCKWIGCQALTPDTYILSPCVFIAEKGLYLLNCDIMNPLHQLALDNVNLRFHALYILDHYFPVLPVNEIGYVGYSAFAILGRDEFKSDLTLQILDFASPLQHPKFITAGRLGLGIEAICFDVAVFTHGASSPAVPFCNPRRHR